MHKQTSAKHAQLLQLAEKRQRTRWRGYRNLAQYHDGAYECHFVSPYTKSANNVDADVFIVLQDWSSHEALRAKLDPDAVWLGHTPGLPTNRNLIRLLETVFQLRLSDTYATNLFPFIKPGGMNTRIPTTDLIRAAKEFAIPQIQIVRPKLVICLGLSVFQALQVVCDRSPAINMSSAIRAQFTFEGANFWCQAHTGGMGQANRNREGKNQVLRDWKRMKRSMDAQVT